MLILEISTYLIDLIVFFCWLGLSEWFQTIYDNITTNTV